MARVPQSNAIGPAGQIRMRLLPLNKWIRRLAAGISLLALAGVVVVVAVLQRGVSRPGGGFRVEDIGQAVEIRFDDRLRPWVRAQSLDDALTAEGWLHARYRLWQMELLRRAGRGRLAEGLGAGMLDTDKALWRAGVPQLAKRLVTGSSEAGLRRVDAYLAGVNAAIAATRSRPPEFWLTDLPLRDWTRQDVFAVGAIISYQSARNHQNELLRMALADRLGPELFGLFLPDETRHDDFPYIVHGDRIDLSAMDELDTLEQLLFPSASLGSSGWAVSPQRTRAGNALFAFDSHDDLGLPNLFYEVHLFYGRDASIRGWSLPGLPGVINGFNQHFAWGLTNIGDTQDLYVETRNPHDPLQFLEDGVWYAADVETAEIPVKGRAVPERLEIVYSRNGPLISLEPPVALRWIGHDIHSGGLESLLAMNTASSLEEFSHALDGYQVPSANITYADRAGHILFRSIGKIPLRGNGRGLYPLPGDKTANRWQGTVPVEDMPRSIDPGEGYVAAANARVHAGQPLISADNAAGYRMARLRQVLGSDKAFDLDDMQTLQLDFYNTQAGMLLPQMLPVLERAGLGETPEVRLLRAWLEAPLNSADSAGALLWEHWYPELAREVFTGRLGPELFGRLMRHNYVLNHALDRLILHESDSAWWLGDRDGVVRASFERTVISLAARFGSDPEQWRWDAANAVYFKHELGDVSPLLGAWLSRGPTPWGGGHPVLGRARYRYDRPFVGRSGATVRVVAEFGAGSSGVFEVRSIIPGGQHGHPSSPHYDDQVEHWLAGELDVLASLPEDVAGEITRLFP